MFAGANRLLYERAILAVYDNLYRSDLMFPTEAEVVGAIYDLGTGKVNWLPEAKIRETLERVETSPDKETEPFAK